MFASKNVVHIPRGSLILTYNKKQSVEIDVHKFYCCSQYGEWFMSFLRHKKIQNFSVSLSIVGLILIAGSKHDLTSNAELEIVHQKIITKITKGEI